MRSPEGVGVEALADAKASPGLRACLHERRGCARNDLVQIGKELPRLVQDLRLSLETAVIGRLRASAGRRFCKSAIR